MIASARRRAARLGLTRTSAFHHGSVEALPFADASFDAVCSVHTIYFWPDLVRGLGQIARVIKPGGQLVLGFSTAEDLRGEGWTEQGFNAYSNDDIIAACRRQGFAKEHLESIERKPRGLSYVYRGVRT